MARPGSQHPSSLSSRGAEQGAAADAVFTEVVRAHAPFVWRVLRGMGVREGDIDDLCQEVFLVVHRKLPALELRAALRSWIYGIAFRLARDYRQRAHRKHELLVGEPPAQTHSASQERALERQQDWALLDRLLGELGEEQRQVFVLFEIEELSMREICEIAGCPLQTAYSRLHAARKRIDEKLAELRAEGSL
jgi:RNA polymerase sigma-70 factor (ECF subfamily)